MGGIDESAIDKLSSVCEFAKLIQSKSQGGCDLRGGMFPIWYGNDGQRAAIWYSADEILCPIRELTLSSRPPHKKVGHPLDLPRTSRQRSCGFSVTFSSISTRTGKRYAKRTRLQISACT